MTADGLLEPANITGHQRSKMKVRNGELAISVGRRELSFTNDWYRPIQLL